MIFNKKIAFLEPRGIVTGRQILFLGEWGAEKWQEQVPWVPRGIPTSYGLVREIKLDPNS